MIFVHALPEVLKVYQIKKWTKPLAFFAWIYIIMQHFCEIARLYKCSFCNFSFFHDFSLITCKIYSVRDKKNTWYFCDFFLYFHDIFLYFCDIFLYFCDYFLYFCEFFLYFCDIFLYFCEFFLYFGELFLWFFLKSNVTKLGISPSIFHWKYVNRRRMCGRAELVKFKLPNLPCTSFFLSREKCTQKGRP